MLPERALVSAAPANHDAYRAHVNRRRIVRRALALLVLSLTSLTWGAYVHSAPEVRDTSAGRTIWLVVAGDASEMDSLRQVAAELLGRLAVTLRADRVDRIDLDELRRPSPSDSRYLARVFVDLREPRRATLWLVDPAHDRILVRQLERSPGGDEVMREELGHILETSTEGLLSGAEIGLPRTKVMGETNAPPDRAPSPAAVLSPPEAGKALRLGFFYEAQALSSQAPVTHGPEASAWLGLPVRRPALGVWVTGQYRIPIQVETGAVGARLEAGALRAMLTFDWPLGDRVRLRAFGGAGVDLVHVAPQASDAAVALADARFLTFATIRTGLGLDIPVSTAVSLGARAAVDIDVSETRYVFATREGDAVLMQPFRLRPALALGISWP